MRTMKMWTVAATLLALSAGAAAADARLAALLAGQHRTPAFAERDRYRHPQQTLEFFGLKPEMTVVEIWPGGGWWTEILAPYLRDSGRYVAAGFVVDTGQGPQYRKDLHARFMARLKADPQHYGKVEVTALGLPDRWQIAPAGSADLVLTFRNVHNWISGGYEREVFAAMFRALRPGGILGVKEHRGRPGMSLDEIKESGYVPEDFVIQLAGQAGFELVAKSEINANPLDNTLHPKGVWTLPPSLRLGEVDRGRYLAIGESDRMTLKFVKPMRVSGAEGAPEIR